MDKLKKLQDEAAEVADRIDAVRGMDLDNDSDIKARDMELEGLVARAESLAKEIDFEKRIADSAANLRSVVDRCTPAPEPVAKEERADVRVEPINYTRKLRAFDNPESAYRVGKWLAGTFLGDADAKRWCMDHGVEARAMGEATMSAGGFAVPEEMANQVIRLVETYGVAPSAMQQANMASDTILFPKRLTGVTAYWIGENSELTTSDPTGTQVSLVAKKLGCGTRVANELLADSVISVADWLVSEFSLELSKKVDEAAFNGDGTSVAYGGIQGITTKINDGTHTASVVAAASGNNSFENLDLSDFSKALGALPRYAIGGAAWYISPAGYHASMERLQMAAGGNMAGDIANGGLPRFLGLPVIQTLVMNNTLGADAGVIKVLVGDAALAGIYGVRNQVNVRSSVDEYARYDQTAWYATLRVDANWHSLGDTSDAGPMVALKTTA
jgi:HK97 family phage major capsid protein